MSVVMPAADEAVLARRAQIVADLQAIVRGHRSRFLQVVCLVTLTFASSAYAQSTRQPSIQPTDAVIEVETAIEIGRAVLVSRLGSKIVAEREPLRATLDEQGIWMVYSSGSPVKNSLKVGDGFFIKIRRSNGEILSIGVLP